MFSKILSNKYLHIILRILLAMVFIITGISKIVIPIDFAKNISNYDMLPNFLVNIVAIVLPWIELISGLMLLLGIRIKANTILMIIMLLIFNIAICTAMVRGLDIDCGCYADITQQSVGFKKLLENFGLILIALLLYYFPNNHFNFESKTLN